MAHSSFYFLVITAGYFLTFTLLRDRVQNWQLMRYGLTAYGAAIALIALSTIVRSIAIADGDPIQAEVWMGGFSWISVGLSGILLLKALLPSLKTIRELDRPARSSSDEE